MSRTITEPPVEFDHEMREKILAVAERLGYLATDDTMHLVVPYLETIMKPTGFSEATTLAYLDPTMGHYVEIVPKFTARILHFTATTVEQGSTYVTRLLDTWISPLIFPEVVRMELSATGMCLYDRFRPVISISVYSEDVEGWRMNVRTVFRLFGIEHDMGGIERPNDEVNEIYVIHRTNSLHQWRPFEVRTAPVT